MPVTLQFDVDVRDAALTVEIFLRKYKGVSRRMLTRLKHISGGICCNGIPVRTIDPVRFGDSITLCEPDSSAALMPSSRTVPVLLNTAAYIVYIKPIHMPVHPSQGHRDDTLGNIFAANYPQLPFRPVYRLDRDTSGICIAAKSAYAAGRMQGAVQKSYLALVSGILCKGGTVCAPIARQKDSIIARCVHNDGKPAVTHFTPLCSSGGYTLVSLWLETGRTHQIRVHMAYLGYPLAGDRLYGGDCRMFSHHMLHCGCVQFFDPETNDAVVLYAPWEELPAEFAGCK